MPTARAGLATPSANGKIYAIGGYFGIGNAVEEYDPISDSWKTKTPMPTSKSYYSAVVIDNKIYTFGGWADVVNLVPSLSIYIYDPTLDQWSQIKDIPQQFALAESVGVSIDDNIYFFGGYNHPNFMMYRNVIMYNIKSEKWKLMDAQIIPRSLGIAAKIVNKIYFIAGEDPFQAWKGLSNVEEYDIATDTITNKTEIPHRRGYLSGCQLDGKIYVIGGTTDWPGNMPNDYLKLNEVYTPDEPKFSVNHYDKLSSTWASIKADK